MSSPVPVGAVAARNAPTATAFACEADAGAGFAAGAAALAELAATGFTAALPTPSAAAQFFSRFMISILASKAATLAMGLLRAAAALGAAGAALAPTAAAD
eukprot:CAMPEP_0180135362 /NCGR_PEP_ID=MMETSP0986-20121125/10792_1 /TAXON_ID=697907 /ORGANISM="non described non described, Strain CCMP2293" /LENGTH=100 /DNA_ID=CAMNT_0022076059 /DNA_START=435 /DNA_END=735 /DNA_ORIENTATION=+